MIELKRRNNLCGWTEDSKKELEMEKMREAEYSEAAVEVLDILNHTNKDDVERIPQSFIKFLTDIASKSYKPQFNHEQPINGLNLRKKTKEFLGFIYITWWCDREEQRKYKKQVYESNIKKGNKF